MRIVQVISDGDVGGAGVLVASVCEALKNEFTIDILLPKGSALIDRLPKEGVGIHPIAMQCDKSFHAADLGLFYRLFRKMRPTVVHTHAALGARIAAMAAGVPYRFSTRHCAVSDYGQARGGGMHRLYNRITTLTVATAEAARRDLCREGVMPGRIVTIRNGAAAVERPPRSQTDALRRSLGILPRELVLGCCARLEPVKGQDLLLRAFARLAPQFKKVKLLLVGSGSMLGEYRRLAATLGIGDRVIFTGYVSDAGRYESLFDVHLNGSRGTETSCLAISECMSLGIPTIASDFGGNTEMIRDEVNGLIFPTDNPICAARAVARVIEDGALRKKLSAGARDAWEKHFSLQHMIRGYRRIYRFPNGISPSLATYG